MFVRTGGTEGLFRKALPGLLPRSGGKFLLLSSDSNNSLAASLEILSFLRENGIDGEVLHGSAESIASRLRRIEAVRRLRSSLCGLRLGVIGAPSDWLISSLADSDRVKAALGVELVDIPIDKLASLARRPGGESAGDEVLSTADGEVAPEVAAALPGAVRIYLALKSIVASEKLDGLTLRCFDLLGSLRNTGCLALAKLNAEGIPSSCEGDVPALLSMTVLRLLTGRTGFMANPSRFDPQSGSAVFAHCTVPFDLVSNYCLDTHFESGIGVGIKGFLPEGPVTVFKLSGKVDRMFAAEGTLVGNLSETNLCRTQVMLSLPPEAFGYFLHAPIGNHHIIVPGRWKDVLDEWWAGINEIND